MDSPNSFKNKSFFPWLGIGITTTVDGHSRRSSYDLDLANLLTVVTSKEHGQSLYLELLIRIAKALSWQLILEEDEDNNENVVIFDPRVWLWGLHGAAFADIVNPWRL